MIRQLLLRLGRLVLTLLLCSFLVYGALYLAPGGVLAALSGGRPLTESARAALTAQYHLDDPFLQRYGQWLWDALHGDLGQSLVARQPVIDLITPRLGTTALLVAYAGLLISVVGVGLGVWAADRGGRVDRTVVATMSAFAAVPAFVASTLLLTTLSVGLRWFPTFGSGDGLGDMLYHLTLPALALAFAAVGYVGRVARTAVLEEKGRDHVQTAVSRGLRGSTIMRSHVLRNAAMPIATSIGVTVASLIAGSVVVEQVFALPGVGTLMLSSIGQKDYAVVQAVALLLVASFVVVNTVVDLLYPVFDPRVRRGVAA